MFCVIARIKESATATEVGVALKHETKEQVSPGCG
jgi:hypothetical protein